LATLSLEVKALRESFKESTQSRDASFKEIKDSIEKLKSKPANNWFQMFVMVGFLSLVFGAYVYPIKTDIDNNRKDIVKNQELAQKDLALAKRDIDDVSKVVANNREITLKDLALIHADFEAVKRENIWNWDGMKTRLDNLTKQLDLMWKRVFGGEDKLK